MEDAQKAYLALLARKKAPACAAPGLGRLAKREFSIAGALIHAGYRREALKEIELARTATPNARWPRHNELRRFVAAQHEFDVVRALDKAGRHEAAKDRLNRTLSRYPNKTPAGGVPADMQRLLEEQHGKTVHRVQGFLERNADIGKELLWLVGKALLWLVPLFVILTFVGYKVVRFLRRPRLSICPFTGGGGTGTDGALAAQGFAFELQTAIDEVARELGGTLPDQALPRANEFEHELVTALPQMKYLGAVIAVINKVIPPRDRELSGFLQPATAKGVGASLVLARRNGRILKQESLRQIEYADVSGDAKASDYATLVKPAAYWVWGANAVRSSSSAPWQAYALFAAGALLELQGDVPKARVRYERSLSFRPPLVGAQLNLATIDLRESSAKNPPDVDGIGRAIARLVGLPKLRATDPDWYRSMYLLVLAYATLALAQARHPGLVLPPDITNPGAKAVATAYTLAETMLEELDVVAD